MILHDKERALHFVCGILNMQPEDFGNYNGFAVLRGGDLIAAIVYHNWHPLSNGGTIQAGIASIHPRWATKETLAAMFSYPFHEVGVTCFRVCCRRSNKRARKFVQRLGFKYEGMARCEWDGREDAACYSMLPNECRWIDAKAKRESADAA